MKTEFKTDASENTGRLERQLDSLYKYGVKDAIRNTINKQSYESFRTAQKNLPSQFTIRNNWTKRGLNYQKSTHRNIDDIESTIGSVNEYMRKQQEGFTQSGNVGVPVPTPATAGQQGAAKRTKKRRKTMLLNAITVQKTRRNFSNKKQQRMAQVWQAMKTQPASKRFVLTTFGRTFGYWKLLGGRKGRKGGRHGWPEGMKPVLVYSMTHKVIRTPSTPWMDIATEQEHKNAAKYYSDALQWQIKKQLRRNR